MISFEAQDGLEPRALGGGQAAMPGLWWNTLGLVFGTGLGMWLVSTIPGPENRTIQRVQLDLFHFSAFLWISAQVYCKNLSLRLSKTPTNSPRFMAPSEANWWASD
jgi:hypothetical protein